MRTDQAVGILGMSAIVLILLGASAYNLAQMNSQVTAETQSIQAATNSRLTSCVSRRNTCLSSGLTAKLKEY